mmetsp:Transcript_41016/g.73960  ORF Transcript_41016/g.73960 Transcript_41016/m.73960 type:complete len:127 (+) Transcript_41016:404-784(+)
MDLPGEPNLHNASSSFSFGLDLPESLDVSLASKASKSRARAGVGDRVAADMENAAVTAIGKARHMFPSTPLRSIAAPPPSPSGALCRQERTRWLLMLVLEKPAHGCQLRRDMTVKVAKLLNRVMVL